MCTKGWPHPKLPTRPFLVGQNNYEPHFPLFLLLGGGASAQISKQIYVYRLICWLYLDIYLFICLHSCWWIHFSIAYMDPSHAHEPGVVFCLQTRVFFQLEQTGHSVSRHVFIHFQLHVKYVYTFNIFMYTCTLLFSYRLYRRLVHDTCGVQYMLKYVAIAIFIHT